MLACAAAARSDEKLDAYFHGHDPEGGPARSGAHRHLFLLHGDADGDGLIDHVSVVAPHRLDRSTSRDEDRARWLAQAVARLHEVRAGPLGTLVLRPTLGCDHGLPGPSRVGAWPVSIAQRAMSSQA